MVKYPSAPRKSVVPETNSSISRKAVSAPRDQANRSDGDAGHDSDLDSEDGGGDLPKEGEVGGAVSGKVRGNMVGSAAGDKVARKLTYPSAQREPGGGVKGNVGQV